MRFTFNTGQMGDTSYIENICKEHKECMGCPVLEKGAIQLVGTGTMYSCSTAIIMNIQKKAKENAKC